MGNNSSYANKELATAATKGNLSRVRFLIEKDSAYINFQDDFGWTPLMHAVSEGHTPVVKYLLTNGADWRQKSRDGSCLLHHAISSLDDEMVDTILAIASEEVNCVNENGWMPLHLATFMGKENMVRSFLAHGAQVSIVNKDGKTPLELASSLAVKKLFEESPAQAQSERETQDVSTKSTQEQIKQLQQLQRPSRPQNIEMKGLLDEGGEEENVNAMDDIADTNSNNNYDLGVLAAIKVVAEIKTDQLDLAQLEELIRFHQQQLKKLTEAKAKLEEQRRKEMERLMAD